VNRYTTNETQFIDVPVKRAAAARNRVKMPDHVTRPRDQCSLINMSHSYSQRRILRADLKWPLSGALTVDFNTSVDILWKTCLPE